VKIKSKKQSKDWKNMESSQKRRPLKAVDQEGMAVKEIGTIKKRSNTVTGKYKFVLPGIGKTPSIPGHRV
jgi:hypothetical protein